jgi:hypothetical protein
MAKKGKRLINLVEKNEKLRICSDCLKNSGITSAWSY